jgi:hypothetical protein
MTKRKVFVTCPFCGALWRINVALKKLSSIKSEDTNEIIECHGCSRDLMLTTSLTPTLKPGQVVTPVVIAANKRNIKKRYEK